MHQNRNKRFAATELSIRANNAIAAGKKIAPMPVASPWHDIHDWAKNHAR